MLNDRRLAAGVRTPNPFLDHAAEWHGNREIVTGGKSVSHKTIYARLRETSNALSGALLSLGLAPGDWLATLAWNT